MLSPAKINLGLKVHHRRNEDGYHYITSIFLPVTFGDAIFFFTAAETSITTENQLPQPYFDDFEKVSERGDITKNLLWIILTAAQKHIRQHVAIRLIKKIPTGAGLGGGSSNAGLLLEFLRDTQGISGEAVKIMASRLGADISFFLERKPMLVSGTGDQMEEIEVGKGCGVLCFPDFGVPTKDAYAALKRPLQTDPPPKSSSLLTEDQRRALKESRWDLLKDLGNDFEDAVFTMHPQLKKVKDAFYENGAMYASMSGSGSAVYGLVGLEADQVALQTELSALFPNYTFHLFQF